MRSVLEIYARGLKFTPINIYTAKARHFQIVDGMLMPSLSSIAGLGEKVAEQICDVAARTKFTSREDFKKRCKVGDTVLQTMKEMNLLDDLPESDQISLESFFGAAMLQGSESSEG